MADSRGYQLEAVLIAFVIFAIVTTSLRFFTMSFILKRFYIEDWLAVVALILYCVYTAIGLLGVHYGLGSHVDDTPLEDRPVAVMYRWLGSLMYIIVSTLSKLIVGFFPLRICSHRRWHRWTIWTIIGVVSVFNTFYLFIAIFACQPVQYEWTRYATPTPSGTCNSTLFATVPTYISAFLNVVADWVLPILPATLISRAKLDRRTKISVCSVLAIGSIASIATIVRLPYARGILDSPDYLYNFTDIGIWSTIECGIALSASSLATLKPLFRRMKFFQTTQSDSTRLTAPAASGRHRQENNGNAPNFMTVGTFVEISAGGLEQPRGRSDDGKQYGDVEMMPRTPSESTSSLYRGQGPFRAPV